MKEKVDVVCHDLPPGSRLEGLFGLSFLKNFNLELYFKHLNLEHYSQKDGQDRMTLARAAEKAGVSIW